MCIEGLSGLRRIRTATTRFAMAVIGSIGAWALIPNLQAADQTLSHSQIADANKPGTIMIYTQWTTKIQVPEEQINAPELLGWAENQLHPVAHGSRRSRDSVSCDCAGLARMRLLAASSGSAPAPARRYGDKCRIS
jgi:hypothetical protein